MHCNGSDSQGVKGERKCERNVSRAAELNYSDVQIEVCGLGLECAARFTFREIRARSTIWKW
jgi:hypothetical protein